MAGIFDPGRAVHAAIAAIVVAAVFFASFYGCGTASAQSCYFNAANDYICPDDDETIPGRPGDVPPNPFKPATGGNLYNSGAGPYTFFPNAPPSTIIPLTPEEMIALQDAIAKAVEEAEEEEEVTGGEFCSADAVLPQGIYVVDDGTPEYAEALQSPDVDGGLVRVGWEMIETSDGTYNWTSVCNKINTVVDAGKSVSLVVSTMSPDWLNSQVSQSELWTHPQFGETVVPWSKIGQEKMEEFLIDLANHDCGDGPLKDLENIKQVDAPILGMLGIRQAPSTDLDTLQDAIIESISIVRDAWGEGHVFYTSLFPLSGCCGGSDDSATIRDAILDMYPDHAFFVENWTGDGPASGPMGDLLQYGEDCRTFAMMIQACGYWSDQNKIKCSFDGSSDTPKNGYDKVVTGYQGQYMEIYPADILAYASDISYIHDAIQDVSCNESCGGSTGGGSTDGGTGSTTDGGDVNIDGFTLTGDPASSSGATWTYVSTDDGVSYNLQGILFKPAGDGLFPGGVVSHGLGGTAPVETAKRFQQWGIVAIGVNYTHSSQDSGGSPAGGEGASPENILRAHKAWQILSELGYVDMNRVVAHGHSMGAFVTAALVGSYPNDFKAASHTAGGVSDSKAPIWTSSALANGITVPYQMHHGDADTVVPLTDDETFDSLLTGNGVSHELHVYPGYTHPDVRDNDGIMDAVKDWYTENGVF